MLAVLAAAAAMLPTANLANAEYAFANGRLEQARIMVAAAIKEGAKGDRVERLLADIAFASRRNEEALARYSRLVQARPGDGYLLEQAAVTALRLGNVAQASQFAERATVSPAHSWRAWNARGVAADMQGAGESAEAFYAEALALAPDRAEVLNNLGWSRLLRGEWEGALEALEQAAALGADLPRLRNNIELARAALASDLPQRRPGETDTQWSARLNDAGVVARVQGDRSRAIAAFSQAILARKTWYARAADNLSQLQK